MFEYLKCMYSSRKIHWYPYYCSMTIYSKNSNIWINLNIWNIQNLCTHPDKSIDTPITALWQFFKKFEYSNKFEYSKFMYSSRQTIDTPITALWPFFQKIWIFEIYVLIKTNPLILLLLPYDHFFQKKFNIWINSNIWLFNIYVRIKTDPFDTPITDLWTFFKKFEYSKFMYSSRKIHW